MGEEGHDAVNEVRRIGVEFDREERGGMRTRTFSSFFLASLPAMTDSTSPSSLDASARWREGKLFSAGVGACAFGRVARYWCVTRRGDGGAAPGGERKDVWRLVTHGIIGLRFFDAEVLVDPLLHRRQCRGKEI